MNDLWKNTGTKLIELIKAGDVTAEEVVNQILVRIDGTEQDLNAYLTLTRQIALAAARRQDSADRRGVLGGLPVAIKDNMCTVQAPTTCASRMLEGYVPPYESTVTDRLWNAGAGLLGKTNMDEFAMGSSNENSAFGPVRNPHDLSAVPGGSSGGSAAAVAAGSALWALGSDTGGSVREPASFCGVVGLKPSYGRVSRYGLIAFASSLDQIGPITRSVPDCARLLSVIAGHDDRDSTSAPCPIEDFSVDLHANIQGLRVGLIKEHMGDGVDAEVRKSILKAADLFTDLGCIVDECSIPHSQYAVAAYYLIAPAEASANLARFDGIRYGLRVDDHEGLMELYNRTRSTGFGQEVKRRIMLGTYALSAGYYDAYYLKGQQVRTLITRDFETAYEQFDVLIGPTCPTTAFKIGERASDPLALYLMDLMTIPANLAGIPAISVPCGTVGGLPVGLQIHGQAFKDQALLNAAYAYEEARGQLPPVDPGKGVSS